MPFHGVTERNYCFLRMFWVVTCVTVFAVGSFTTVGGSDGHLFIEVVVCVV